MNETLEQGIKNNNMLTNTKKAVIIHTDVCTVDYDSKNFREKLEKVKQENDRTSEYQLIDRDRMYTKFDI